LAVSSFGCFGISSFGCFGIFGLAGQKNESRGNDYSGARRGKRSVDLIGEFFERISECYNEKYLQYQVHVRLSERSSLREHERSDQVGAFPTFPNHAKWPPDRHKHTTDSTDIDEQNFNSWDKLLLVCYKPCVSSLVLFSGISVLQTLLGFHFDGVAELASDSRKRPLSTEYHWSIYGQFFHSPFILAL